MADADSLVDLGNSDAEGDLSEAVDADVEEDETSLDGNLASGRHKKTHKKHKSQRKAHKQVPDTTSDSEENSVPEEQNLGHAKTTDTGDANYQAEIKDHIRQPVPISLLNNLRGLQLEPGTSAPKSLDDATKRKYQFWETQPVPKFGEKITESANGPIEEDKPLDQIRQTPLTLPQGFQWDTLDINDGPILEELYTLLNENYVEDDDNMFRFDYSPGFLKWALQPPGWHKDWHCGVRVAKSHKLVGFISAIPMHMQIYNIQKTAVEINFLCVHKKLRSKRVAPVLIREITRRVNCKGIFQAVYTAGVVLPRPVASCRYWHRSLNPKKLIEVKFSHLGRNMTMQRTLKLYKLPDKPQLPGFRQFTQADLTTVYSLVNQYLSKFMLAPIFSKDEFEHWFMPRDGIIYAYVNEVNGVITDFISFYSLPSTIMQNPQYNSLKAAYSFYMATTPSNRVSMMNDALIMAKQLGFDVFNALDLMDNKEFLEKLKFGIGDGNLQYYIYNWKCTQMTSDQVGLVLQ